VTSRPAVTDLARTAARIRGKLVELSCRNHVAHLGGSLSCAEIVTALYWDVLAIDPARPADEGRDRFVFSKGHAAAALYTALSFRGFFPEEVLETLSHPGSPLPEHPVRGSVPGVEATTGSLGHGLPIGLGMALAARVRGLAYRVHVLVSDGECNEGSVWEAALMAPAQRVENLAVIVDLNRWQATGRSEEVMALQPLRAKWEAFGWSAKEIDGHDLAALVDVLRAVPDGSGKPVAVVCRTVKGKGISFMEDDNNWHYRIPTEDEYRASLRELGLA
jgi:transketolase